MLPLWINQYTPHRTAHCIECQAAVEAKTMNKFRSEERKSLAQVLIIKLIRWDSVLHQIAISAIILIVSLMRNGDDGGFLCVAHS